MQTKAGRFSKRVITLWLASKLLTTKDAATGTQSSHRGHRSPTVPADLADLAPRSPVRRTGPSRYQANQAKAHSKDDSRAPKARLPNRNTDSRKPQARISTMIFDPVPNLYRTPRTHSSVVSRVFLSSLSVNTTPLLAGYRRDDAIALQIRPVRMLHNSAPPRSAHLRQIETRTTTRAVL